MNKVEGCGTQLNMFNRNGIVGIVSLCVSVYSDLKCTLQSGHSLCNTYAIYICTSITYKLHI